MSDLRFEYQNGRIVAAVIDLDGPNNLRVGVSGIDTEEAKSLKAAFQAVSPFQLAGLSILLRDGALDEGEKAKIKNYLQNILDEDPTIDAQVTTADINRSPAVPPASPAPSRLALSANADPNDPKVLKMLKEQYLENVLGFKIDKDSIAFSKNGKELHMNLTGLSIEEADKLEEHLLNNRDAANKFVKTLREAAADQMLNANEVALLKNDTEKLLDRANISADVTTVRISANPPKP